MMGHMKQYFDSPPGAVVLAVVLVLLALVLALRWC